MMPEDRDLAKTVAQYNCGCVMTDDRANGTISLAACGTPDCVITPWFTAHYPDSEVKEPKAKSHKADA